MARPFLANPSEITATGGNHGIKRWIINKKVTCPGTIQIYHEEKREEGTGKENCKLRILIKKYCHKADVKGKIFLGISYYN